MKFLLIKNDYTRVACVLPIPERKFRTGNDVTSNINFPMNKESVYSNHAADN